MVARLLRFARPSQGGSGSLVVGADLGARRIKVVALEGTDRPEMIWAVDVPTPGGIFGAEGQFDSVAAGRVLAQLLAGAPFSGPVAGAVVLPSAALRVRRLQAGTADPAGLARLLADDSELRVPGVAVEGLFHAVSALGDTPSLGRGDAGRPLLAAATRRDALRAYAAAGGASGLRPLRLAAPATALANVHAELHPEETGRAVALLHVGAVRTDLVVVHDGAPLLVLPVVQGTDQLYGRLREAAGPGAPDPERLLLDDAPSAGVAAALEEWMGRLRGSHRTAVGAAERHLREGLDELPVRISGGVVRFPGVVDRLAAALPAPVRVLDPAPRFPNPPGSEALGPALVLALGAAVEARAARRAAGSDGGPRPVQLDLSLPEARTAGAAGREATAALVRDPAAWAALLAALLLGAGIPAGLQTRLGRLEAELERGRQAYALEAGQVAADSARVASLQADSARLAGTLGTLAALEANRYGWPRLMHAAADALPPYGWMEGLELEPAAPGRPSRFRVRAVTPTQADVSRYERALGEVTGASQVALEGSESLELGSFPLVGFRVGGMYGGTPAGLDQPRPGGAGYHAGTPTALPPDSAR